MEKEEIGVIVENTQDCESKKYAHIFNEEGGFIGSSFDNAFCLQDTQNKIQDKHIQITFEEGCFALTPVENCIVHYNNAFSSMEGGYGTIINLNDTVKIGDIVLRFVDPKSVNEDMLKKSNILKDLQKQPQEEEKPIRPKGQISVNFNEKENIKELIDSKNTYDFLEKKFDDSFLKQIPNVNTTTFDYNNILKLLDKGFKEIQSNQKNSKFNDVYEDLTLKDLEGIIGQVPLIKSTKLINLLALSLISKELYSPIFEEMEEDMFVKYLKIAIQSNVKEEKHLFENLTIKALEKYRK